MKIQASNGIMYAHIIEDVLNHAELLALKDRTQEKEEIKFVKLEHLIIATATIIHNHHLTILRGLDGFGNKITYTKNTRECKPKKKGDDVKW